MRFFAATLAAVLLSACAAGQQTTRTEIPGHAEVRRLLALEPGTTWEYAFEARIEEDEDGVTRETRAEGGYIEAVRRVREEGPLTVVEVLRQNLGTDDELGGWMVQRRAGPIYYVIGGRAQVHEAPAPDAAGRPAGEYGPAREGRAVYVQRDASRPGELPAAWLAYVLPLRPGVLWHAEPEARDLARRERTLVGVRAVLEHVPHVETPAGRFEDCFLLSTPGNKTRTTSWVCSGVGLVRRHTERADGSPRFVIEETLRGFARK